MVSGIPMPVSGCRSVDEFRNEQARLAVNSQTEVGGYSRIDVNAPALVIDYPAIVEGTGEGKCLLLP